MSNPVRTTIIFGFLAGLLVIPEYWFFGSRRGLFEAFNVALCVDLAVYAVLLARWSKTRMISILYPVVLMLGTAVITGSHQGFFLLILGIFSWIRSGVCFGKTAMRGLSAEMLTVGGGTGLVVLLNPSSAVTWALSVWLFFLVQSLFFYIVPSLKEPSMGGEFQDPFETARKEAENVLESIP